MKKCIWLAAVTAAVMALAGCESAVETKTIIKEVVQKQKVGDELTGNYFVTYVDPKSTGYIAVRAAEDKSGDGDIRDAAEGVYAEIGGTFTSDITIAKLAKATDALPNGTQYLPATVIADTTKYTDGVDNKITWYMKSAVFIGQDNANNATVTIEAGAKITGSDAPGMLVITRGSKIMAEGTATDPIVFTSSRLAGSRAAGDWGGIILNGNAPINDGDDGDNAQAGGSAEGEGNTGKYGGTVADDNSGVMKYVRIEFAGKLFTADNELNGLALQGVGSGTTLSYIQIHNSADDGIEFFGGAANVDHLVVTGAQDDSVDWTSGWIGKAQFVVVQQYSNTSTDLGIEADNKEGGVDYLPRSNPTLANFTLIGRGASGKGGALFRRGTDVAMYNSVFTNFKTGASLTDFHSSGNGHAFTLDGLYLTEAVASTATATLTAAVTAGTKNVTTGTFVNSLLPSTLTDTDFTNDTFKASGTPAGYTAATLPSGLAAGAFLGAIDPAGADWTSGWITSAQN